MDKQIDVSQLSSLYDPVIYELDAEARREKITTGISGIVGHDISGGFNVMKMLLVELASLVNNNGDAERQIAVLEGIEACATELAQKISRMGHLGSVQIFRRHTAIGQERVMISQVFNEIADLANRYKAIIKPASDKLAPLRSSHSVTIDVDYLIKSTVDLLNDQDVKKAIMALSNRISEVAIAIVNMDPSAAAHELFVKSAGIAESAKSVLISRNDNYFRAGLIELQNDVISLLHDNHSRSLYNRILMPPLSEGDVIFGQDDKYLNFEHGLEIIADICQLVLVRIEDSLAATINSPILIKESAAKVARSIPEQQIAPVKFGTDNDLLVVVHEVATPEQVDEQIVNSVRRGLLKSGERLIRELRQSQCDRRYVESIEELQEEIEANQDIIQLGMQGQSCQVTANAFGEEFSNFHKGLLAAHLMAVMDYVGQFPVWNRFLENAAGAKMLEQEMVDGLRDLVRDLAQTVRNAPIAEPEVTEELDWLVEQIADDRPVSKKIMYAVGQSVQNFASAFMKLATDIVSIADGEFKTIIGKGMAWSAAGGIAVVLWHFVPISNILAQNPWLAPALQWLKELLPMLSGG